MNHKKIIMTSGISAALLALILVFFGPNVAHIVKNAQDQTFGATSVQVTDGDCLVSPAGEHICGYRTSLSATSTMLCVFKSPNATTTLRALSMNITNAGSIPASVAFDFSTSSTPFASSTPTWTVNNLFGVGTYVLPMTWSTTTTNNNGVMSPVNAQGLSAMILGPNTYFGVKTSTTTPATTYPSGSCTGEVSY